MESYQLKTVSTMIVALATAAIVSMDLGVPYSASETSIYTNMGIQTVVISSVAYSITEDINQSIVITLLWLAIKYNKQQSLL